MEDRCVCCGEIVPEGRMVCPKCEAGAAHPANDRESPGTPPDTPKTKRKFADVLSDIGYFSETLVRGLIEAIVRSGVLFAVLGYITSREWFIPIAIVFNATNWLGAFLCTHYLLKDEDDNDKAAGRLPRYTIYGLVGAVCIWYFCPL